MNIIMDLRQEYLYIIKIKNTDKYKIGRSCWVDDRMKTLQTGNPDELIIYKIYKYHSCPILESHMHVYAKNNRIKGEWFKFTENKLKDIDKEIIRYIKCNPNDSQHIVFESKCPELDSKIAQLKKKYNKKEKKMKTEMEYCKKISDDTLKFAENYIKERESKLLADRESEYDLFSEILDEARRKIMEDDKIQNNIEN
jgi:hypothetical protein